MTTKTTEINEDLAKKLVALAKEAARLMFAEYGDEQSDEPDVSSWEENRNDLGLKTRTQVLGAWPVYEAAFNAEMNRLCGL
jgi:hypothetical protein